MWDKAHKNEAAGNTVPNLYKGQICLTGGGVWWNNFTVGAQWGGTVSSVQMGPGHCNTVSSGKWDLSNCSSSRRFAIFVRPIDCTRAGHCASLNRSQCYDTPNTCGNCTAGFKVHSPGGVVGPSNEACSADCSAMPGAVCSSLHREPCAEIKHGLPHTCGPCLKGYGIGGPPRSNSLCAPTGLTSQTPPRSCYEIQRQLESRQVPARTGKYLIAPHATANDDGETEVVSCEMSVDGGGWTSIFTSDSGPCSGRHPRDDEAVVGNDYYMYDTCARDNLRYSSATLALRADESWVGSRGPADREVLIGFIDETGSLSMAAGRASFLIPAEWVESAPMSYLREHINISASVNGAARAVHTLVFGSSYFESDCDYRHHQADAGPRGFQEDVPASIGGNPPGYHGYRGQICLMTAADSPWWSNFSTGDMSKPPRSEPERGYCKSGLSGGAPRRGFAGSEGVTQCSATRRFAIFVREVECGSQTADVCKSLNRHPCFSTKRTCGRCLPGYVGPAPRAAPADRGALDDNSPCEWRQLPSLGSDVDRRAMKTIDEDEADADERHEGGRIVAAGHAVHEEQQEQHVNVDECADTQELERLKQENERLRLELRLQAKLNGQPGADQ
jgi:hypothetical protein